MSAQETLPETWIIRELPILRAALRRFDAGAPNVDLEEIRAEIGLHGLREMRPGIQALMEASPPFLDAYIGGGWREDYASGMVTRIGERTRRELGTWPSADTIVSQLARALSEAADSEQEPEHKRRLKAVASTVAGVGRDVLEHYFERKFGV